MYAVEEDGNDGGESAVVQRAEGMDGKGENGLV